jgi:sugar phosphate permease
LPDNASDIIFTKDTNVKPPITQRVILLAILFLTLLVAYLDRVNVSILVTDGQFLDAMGIKGQPVRIGLLMTLFLIAYGVSNVLFSPLGDWMGPRKAMSLSIFLWGAALVFGGLSSTCIGPCNPST